MIALEIAAILGPVYLIFGLSILFYQKAWLRLVDHWSKEHFSFFALSVFNLVFGLLIIRMYNVWEGNVWILITISGWLMFLKGAFYLLAPGEWIKQILAMKGIKGWIAFGGIILAVLGAILSYYSYFPASM